MRSATHICAAAILAAAATLAPGVSQAQTTYPISHVVVIFQENVSFDHYFATYPYATNPAGEPAFQAKDDTPRVNNLKSSGLLDHNPNVPTGPTGQNPFRMDRSHVNTCDQDHVYGDEQYAFHAGLM